MEPKRLLPRERRANLIVLPIWSLPGAPIQQATPQLRPEKWMPADASGLVKYETRFTIATRSLSRESGTGGQSRIATQSHCAAR
jgi:hypothetical protein